MTTLGFHRKDKESHAASERAVSNPSKRARLKSVAENQEC
jgi:hypothetical protein